jgi:hypothetical protein
VTMRCAVGYMLENPVYLAATRRSLSYPIVRVNGMDGSENAESAENQQERLFTTGWLVGFVDGEGCFSCPIFRNRSMRVGWQVQPSFTVVQGQSSREALEEMVRFFGCGRVYRSRRQDNHREDLLRYQVYRFSDLRDVIVPFFSTNPLRTSKRDNFEKFAQVIDLMILHRHLSVPGLIEIAEIAQTMNFRKPSEALRILRDHTPTLFAVSSEEDEMARPLWRHREAGGNAQPAVPDSPPDRSYK